MQVEAVENSVDDPARRYRLPMSDTARPPLPGRRRRRAGTILLWISAAFVAPAFLVHALDGWIVPGRMPPEVLIPLLLPLLAVQSAWWLFGVLNVVGLLLLIRTPGSRPAAILGTALLFGWVLTVLGFAHAGAPAFAWA